VLTCFQDEIADFNESGVTLYFLSMWNAFDFIIFLLFMTWEPTEPKKKKKKPRSLALT